MLINNVSLVVKPFSYEKTINTRLWFECETLVKQSKIKAKKKIKSEKLITYGKNKRVVRLDGFSQVQDLLNGNVKKINLHF